jgi:phosphopantothenoylcysteine decarboxylase/phosphopantothenate--cysteine ligase
MHPSEEIRGADDWRLKGKKVVIGITGSIAAVECVKLIRALVRRGADVVPVMSDAAEKIVHPDAIWFACGHKPITSLDGETQHVALCGEVPDRADLLLIAPATANTISKIAWGVDDTPVTTFATTAIGTGIPVIIVPAMHASMYKHPIVGENVVKLKSIGVRFVGPVMRGTKARMAENAEIVASVARILSGEPLKDKRIVIVSGAFSVPWDDVRSITSKASGETGRALAVEAYERGADVLLIQAGSDDAPSFVHSLRADTVDELLLALKGLDADAIIVPAAIPDYAPEPVKGKVPSDRAAVSLKLKRVPKVLGVIRKSHGGVLVGFKAESGVSDAELAKRAKARMKEHRLDIIVANDVRKVKPGKADALIIGGKKASRVKGTRKDLAAALMDEVGKLLV